MDHRRAPRPPGRRALVTGANSGIGAVEALERARHGADVVLAVRKPDAGRETAERIRAAGVPGTVTVEQLDLASQASVHALADRFEGPLDLLVNNAGVMAPPRHRKTADGFELQFGTNHLGHFALTGLLMPHLLEAPAPRVTTVSSVAHHNGDGAVLEGNPAKGYNPQTAYGRSKLANLLFATELQRRATASGSRLTSTAAHPGDHWHEPHREPRRHGRGPAHRHPDPVDREAALPRPRAGRRGGALRRHEGDARLLLRPPGFRETRGPVGEAKLSALVQDTTLAALLWERSEEFAGVTFFP